MKQQRPQTLVGALEDAVIEAIKTVLDPGEIVTHFDLVASTRHVVDGEEKVSRRHWTLPGADPHLSYAVLNAQAAQILKRDLT